MRPKSVGRRFYIGRSHLGDYMRRWLIQTPWFTIRLHHILRPDSGRDHHDHPWDFTSRILKGGYMEERPGIHDESILHIHTRGAVIRRKAEDLHTIRQVSPGGVWTFVLTGPRRREWGFQTPEGWVHWKQYHNYDEQLTAEPTAYSPQMDPEA